MPNKFPTTRSFQLNNAVSVDSLLLMWCKTETENSGGYLVLSSFCWDVLCSNIETKLSLTYFVSGFLRFKHSSVLLFVIYVVTLYISYLSIADNLDTLRLRSNLHTFLKSFNYENFISHLCPFKLKSNQIQILSFSSLFVAPTDGITFI